MKHSHRWQIEEPNGPFSMGRCACGTERKFRNSLGIDVGVWRDWSASQLELAKQRHEMVLYGYHEVRV